MFQHAASSVLAHRLKAKLYHDLGWFDLIKNRADATQRVYELDQFGIKPRTLTTIGKLKLKFQSPHDFKEQSLEYKPKFVILSGNILLDGYWQSYKYYKGNEKLVESLFNFPKCQTNANLADAITNSESISVHIRRGDYSANPKTKALHGLMPDTYYEAAIKSMAKGLKNPRLFVFSDDPEWAKKNFKSSTPFVVAEQGRGVDDMHLMSLCKRNILANSSFSWWAAWLNKNSGKQIVAPKKWFEASSYTNPDLLPKDWIKL